MSTTNVTPLRYCAACRAWSRGPSPGCPGCGRSLALLPPNARNPAKPPRPKHPGLVAGLTGLLVVGFGVGLAGGISLSRRSRPAAAPASPPAATTVTTTRALIAERPPSPGAPGALGAPGVWVRELAPPRPRPVRPLEPDERTATARAILYRAAIAARIHELEERMAADLARARRHRDEERPPVALPGSAVPKGYGPFR